ncbi:MAG: hut operon positive regulator HutP, partial [Syntrophomonadaceae bacterium]|nr:hut operon positive regulator HutP [Syntrophomonadaceae bacterium]
MEPGSKIAASSAIKMALSASRAEEVQIKKALLDEYGIRAVAVDYGGEFISSMAKIVERSVVAAKREGVIKDTHSDEGAVAGASREALSQIMPKALGLNVGGKIGVARYQD